MKKRTQKDEDEYIARLRREGPIKTEIIRAMKQQVRTLLESQERTLSALIRAEQALLVYRSHVLEQTAQRLRSSDDDSIIGLPQFYWNAADGWHRIDEKSS